MIAPATRNITQIQALEELLTKTMATTPMDIRRESPRHITMIARSRTLVEVMVNSPMKNGAVHRKMTAITTISTKTPVMNIQTLNVTSLMVLLTVTRLALSSKNRRRMVMFTAGRQILLEMR